MEYKCWREITWGHMVGLQSWSDENVPPHICVIWSDDMNMQGNILVSVMTKLMCWECRARESEEFQEQRMLIGRRGHKILRPVFFFFFPSGVHIFSTSESREKISSDQKLAISLPVAFCVLSQGDDSSHALHVFPTGCFFVSEKNRSLECKKYLYIIYIYIYIYLTPLFPNHVIGIFT